MDRTPQEKFILLFEAAKRSLLSADLLLKRMQRELDDITQSVDQSFDYQEIAALPIISCACFVDFAFRFHSLIKSLHLVRSDAPQLKRLSAALAPVETARHHLQHLQGKTDLSSDQAIEYPLLGSISWVRNNSNYSMCINGPVVMASFESISYDRQEQKWMAQHEYVVKDAVIDLDLTLLEMHKAYQWIAKAIVCSDPRVAELKWSGAVAIKMGFPNT